MQNVRGKSKPEILSPGDPVRVKLMGFYWTRMWAFAFYLPHFLFAATLVPSFFANPSRSVIVSNMCLWIMQRLRWTVWSIHSSRPIMCFLKWWNKKEGFWMLLEFKIWLRMKIRMRAKRASTIFILQRVNALRTFSRRETDLLTVAHRAHRFLCSKPLEKLSVWS